MSFRLGFLFQVIGSLRFSTCGGPVLILRLHFGLATKWPTGSDNTILQSLGQ